MFIIVLLLCNNTISGLAYKNNLQQRWKEVTFRITIFMKALIRFQVFRSTFLSGPYKQCIWNTMKLHKTMYNPTNLFMANY